MEISPPSSVAAALAELEHAGFKAYIVGGCVRDAILGIVPRDWDICTSAAPRETAAIFEKRGYKVIETGPAYGTVSVIIDGERMEITTFRSDGEYSDNRRPDSVSFVRDIFTDLARRDFTMNAMAYNGGLTDPFGGVRDISARLIRCVGDPGARFREDALRIMRAVRFASELGFHIEDETRNALFENAPLLKNIAVERISAELNKLLTGKHAYETLTEYRAALLHAIPELPESLPLIERAVARDTRQRRDVAFPVSALNNNHNHLTVRLALVFKGLGGEGAATALRRLRYPRSVVREVSYRISRGDVFGTLPRLADLALRGGDLVALGLKGPEIGKMLESLLDRVITGELPNERDALLKAAEITSVR
ncbi:MAG: polynucleotide adenylyltransferase [Oscillospiraceae bacterium]|nr:polynucleotide adenylyltransferase [Oscillospiraceae bacterium]